MKNLRDPHLANIYKFLHRDIKERLWEYKIFQLLTRDIAWSWIYIYIKWKLPCNDRHGRPWPLPGKTPVVCWASWRYIESQDSAPGVVQRNSRGIKRRGRNKRHREGGIVKSERLCGMGIEGWLEWGGVRRGDGEKRGCRAVADVRE